MRNQSSAADYDNLVQGVKVLNLNKPVDEKSLAAKMKNIPTEIWLIILETIEEYPISQLLVFATVSRIFRCIVLSSPLWEEVCKKARLKPKKTEEPYEIVAKNANRICENCFAWCQKKTSNQALPVYRFQDLKEVRLCLRCRQEFYTDNPEPLSHIMPNWFVNKTEVKLIYKLDAQDTQGLCGFKRHSRYNHDNLGRKCICYNERDILSKARSLYGGDVGLRAISSKFAGHKRGLTLYVGNLPYSDSTTLDLDTLFMRFGDVLRVTNKGRYAFVVLCSAFYPSYIAQVLNGTWYNKRKLVINVREEYTRLPLPSL